MPKLWQFDPELHKCPYCGTSYFDMSSIDITNHEPFYLKIKMDMGGRPAYITQLVRPRIGSMEVTYDTTDCMDGYGTRIRSFISDSHATTNISFEAIRDKNGALFNMYMEE